MRYGLAVIDNGSLLVVRPRGDRHFILPGGKPRGGESASDCLLREIAEELDTRLELASLAYVGSFVGPSAEPADGSISLELYQGTLDSRPTPASEIEELAWISIEQPARHILLAPLLRRKVLPHLRARG